MKKYMTAFSMAWGNFCTIPCPIKRWNTNYQSLMLGWFPAVGLIIGVLWSLAYLLFMYLGLPFLAVAFLMTFLPYALYGFIHLDGFMDCSDAILSRRPLEERQRILKDSHTGAFAVISVVLLLLASYSFMATSISQGIDFVNLAMIAVTSRIVVSFEVILSKPLKVSQYTKMHQSLEEENLEGSDSKEIQLKEIQSKEEEPKEEDVTSKKSGIVLLLIQIILYSVLCLLFCTYLLGSGFVILLTILGTLLAAAYGKKQLGGMNGDIAGYSLVWGELLGVFALMFA